MTHRSIKGRTILFSLLLAGAFGGSGFGVPASSSAKAAKAAKAEAPKWEVGSPPGEAVTVTIETSETTWSSVDVSPDGRMILFDMLGDLYTAPIEGGEARALTSGVEWDFQPRFSPDGKEVAFISDRSGGDNLWIVRVDGSGARAVSQEADELVHNPSWSPDGQYLVAKKDFTSTRSIPAGEIWMFHVGGGGGLQITERPNGKKDQKTMAEPAFSPDGRYIYYSQDTTPGQRWDYNKDSTGQIFVIKRFDRERGETEVITGGPGGAIRPVPSPNGKQLAFVRRLPSLTSALYLRDLATGNERPLFDRLDRDLQETNGSHGNSPGFAWTPDSRSVVFWAGGQFHRHEVETGQTSLIPIHVKTQRSIQPALRFPVQVAPEIVRARMLRWVQNSPVDSRVVFQAFGYLWVADAAGTHRLTSQTDHFEFWPAFSRDGRFVVYTTYDDEALGSVRVVPIDGGSGRIVSPAPGHYVEPQFSPSGDRLVYRKIVGGYLLSPFNAADPGIYVVSREGGPAKLCVRSGESPHFGSSDARLYFTETADETDLLLKSVNLDGLDPRTHLKGTAATEFRVSPDDRWVAFTEGWNAWVAPFTATGRTFEISSESKAVPVRRVSARSGRWLHWSGSSDRIYWAHGPTLYSRDLAGAFPKATHDAVDPPEPVASGQELVVELPADRPAGRIALVGGRVVTMRDARRGLREVIDEGVVLLDGPRIAAVGSADEVAVPADARIIDCSGTTVIPGLVDVHAHGAMAQEGLQPRQNWMQYSNLSFGVTTIHDPSNDTASISSAAELQRSGLIVTPRIFSTGTILYGAHAPGYSVKVDSLEDAEFHVRRMKDVGAISVKSYQLPRRDQRQQLLAAARKLGMMVVPEGGAKFEHNLTEIVDGHTGIEHAIPLRIAYDDVLQLWSRTEVGYTPTLGVAYGGLSGETYWYDRSEVWKNERLMRFVPRSVVEPAAMRRLRAPDGHYNHIDVARFAKRLADRGVSVQIGAHGQREGLASHWEIWMLGQGGFDAWEALRAATIQGAWYVGLDGAIGSIEVGKLADLAIVEGNPLAELKDSQRVSQVVLNGRVYDAATLEQVAPDTVPRRPFYFELPGGDTIHPAAAGWYAGEAERLGWNH